MRNCLVYNPIAGADPYEVAKEMIAMARKNNNMVIAKFNNQGFFATPDSTLDSMMARYFESKDAPKGWIAWRVDRHNKRKKK